MPKAGKRYPLLIYTRMIDRWWPATFCLALALFGLAWGLRFAQWEEWRPMTLDSAGGLSLLVTVFLLLIRKGAYVQPFSDHMRLATPFLRLNISYKRIRRTSPAVMNAVFPLKSISEWRSEIIEPMVGMTAVVVELNGYPISQTVLRFFLSPFFFKDKTPHFVLLVKDWMRFSTELESMRVSGNMPSPKGPRGDQSILSRLPQK